MPRKTRISLDHLQAHTVSKCGHACHPSSTTIDKICPVCEVIGYLSTLDTIAVAWTEAGGPTLGPETYIASRSQVSLRNRWHAARCELQKLLDTLSTMALYEESWETKYPCSADAAQETNCASEAITLAQEECRYPARLSLVNTTALKTDEFLRKKQQQRVTFSTEIQIKDGNVILTSATKFVQDRPRHVFRRHRSTYKPGEHTCPTGSEYIDTSQLSCLVANVSNLKIYVTDDEDWRQIRTFLVISRVTTKAL